MRRARTRICLKIGLTPAFFAALLPVAVALFHLMPVMMAPDMVMPATMPGMSPAPAAHHNSARHEHHHHDETTVQLASADLESAAVDDDCHPPGEPCDDPPRTMGMHCPLCLWLQGFHALPAPVVPALRLPSARAAVVQHYEAPVTRSFAQSTSQPRAPPIFLLT